MKEILTAKQDEFSIEVSGNEISSIRNKNITKKGARIFDSGKIYSSSFVGDIGDQELIKLAHQNIDGAIDYNYPLPATKSIRAEHYLNGMSKDDFYLQYERTLNQLRLRFPNFIFSGKAILNRVSESLSYLDKANLEISFDVCGWYLLYKHHKSASIMDGCFGASSIATIDMQSVAEDYYPYLESFEKVAPISEKTMPVVFVHSGDLYGKILEGARADFYKKDIGLFKGKLGEKILNEKFSLYDISFDPELSAMNLFDSEGFVREEKKLAIIENGVFKNIIADARNAHKYQIPITGNGHRSFNSNISLGFNTVVAGVGKRSTKDILAELPECIIVEMASGGDFTDLGDYSTPVQNAFLAKYGQIVGKIPQITISSSVQKMFGEDLIEVASDALSRSDVGPSIFIKMKVQLN